MLPRFTKKSLGQPAHARVTNRATPRFSRLKDSLQLFTGNEYLAYKHKNNVINSNTPLCVTTVDRPHFTTVCTTRARGTRVSDFVTEWYNYYRVHYTADYAALKIRNASR